MISFPPCKINLGLHVINKREDGFHNIETCFYPVPWNDVLEIIPASETKIFLTGNAIPGEPNLNLVLKAYEILRNDFSIGSVEIYLHKIIPYGAGLGGGSSDGADALKLLIRLFELNVSTEKLKGYALKLGSDCPFFLEATPMLATGRGDVLNPSIVNLSGLTLVIVKPPVHVSTVDAYTGVIPKAPNKSLSEIISQPVSNWKSILKNDFEETVLKKHLAIAELKNKLYRFGALYASMSGSGSAVYGLFESEINIENQFPGMICWQGKL